MATSSTSCTALVVYAGDNTTENNSSESDSKGTQKFVGLSNQGATCYMNSLLQTLYMTPEFRTALYKWQYNPEKDGNEAHCIPLQLQKLFGLLQLSKTRSVDTIALTKSFGWEGSEVFQQQDVQELCRVLFDALEESFKGSEVEKAIDDIYAGEMVDYVKCLDVDYQSERRDKFLDCSLAIRPYGSSKSMKSLTECLEHYLEPEILDGDNKYYAESVGRKVDAIKGLKFSRLPRVLSVQLKRFVYDFSGDSIVQMKINDEVQFPLILDLNKYVSRCQKLTTTEESKQKEVADGEKQENENEHEHEQTQSPQEKQQQQQQQQSTQIIDEFEEFLQKRIRELREKKSENDSPSLEERKGGDWNSGKGSPASLVCEDDNLESKDDLDIPDLVDCNGNLHPDLIKTTQIPVGPIAPPKDDPTPELKTQYSTNLENVNLQELVEQRGEWIYELYAVLVHSGAISGGHYYVYIKDVETNKWWNFNDSYVDEITVDKVFQASGGMVNHTSYYGVKSSFMSSANAYMLMYRKYSLSQSRVHFPPDSMVPSYIKEELQKLTELAEKKRKEDEERYNRLPLQIYWRNKSHSVISNRHVSYKALLQQIWTELDLFNTTEYQEILKRNKEIEESKSIEVMTTVDPLVVPTDEIRLRIYSSYNKLKQEPFNVETRGNLTLEAIRVTTYRELIIELRSKYEEWEEYEPDGFNIQLNEYDAVKDELKPHVSIRLSRVATLIDLKTKISQLPETNYLEPNQMRLMKLSVWSFSEVKVDEITSNTHDTDNYRLVADLRLCEGQKLYLESNTIPLQDSPCVKCFTNQINLINVIFNNPGVPDEPEHNLLVDRRSNMNELRQLIGKELNIEPDSFRIFRKTAMEAELNGDKSQTLYALGIYNGIALHLAIGKPLLPGHYLLKLYLNKSPFRAGLHDLQEIKLPPLDSIAEEGEGGGGGEGGKVATDAQAQAQAQAAAAVDSSNGCLPETIDTPVVIEASATVIDPADCNHHGGDNVVVADTVDSVPVTVSDATPIVTGTPVSLNDIDIEVLTNGVTPTTATATATNDPPKNGNYYDPFKITEDTVESSSSDILGFGYKMIELVPPNDQFEFLMDFDVEADSKISDLKQRIFDYLLAEGRIPSNYTPNHIRIRAKSKTTLSGILSSTLTLRENQIHLFSGRELSAEVLDHEEFYSSLPFGDVVAYVQKWNRQTWSLEKPMEVIMRANMTVHDISRRLAALTNIKLDGLRVILLQPYNEIKLCDLYLNQPAGPRPWINTVNDNRKLSQMQWYLRDWDTLLVQDINEPLKKLSKTEIQTVQDAKAYQSNYGYDYYYNVPYTPVSNTATNTNGGGGTTTSVVSRPARVEKGIHIKTQKDREKERLENEKKDGIHINGGSGSGSGGSGNEKDSSDMEVVSSTSSAANGSNSYVLFSDIE